MLYILKELGFDRQLRYPWYKMKESQSITIQYLYICICFLQWGFSCAELGTGRMLKRSQRWLIGYVQSVEVFATAVFASGFLFVFFYFFFELVMYPWIHSNKGVVFVESDEVKCLLVKCIAVPKNLALSQLQRC